MKSNSLRILLIEDNIDHAELVKRCFEQHKVLNSLIHLSDGESAISYLKGINEFSDRNANPLPDLILLDLRIPKIDGLDVLASIKDDDNIKHIPVVVLTSSANDKDIDSAYKSYVNSYLVKPLDFSKFVNLINELGFYWLSWNKASFGNNETNGAA